MSDEKITYTVTITAEEEPDIDEIDRQVQESLLDVYDQGEIENIRVSRERRVSKSDDIQRLLDVIESIRSKDIRKSIDLVAKQEGDE